MKKVCIFISDEGFGHVVRQTAIISILLKKIKNLQITVVTNSKIYLLKEYCLLVNIHFGYKFKL